jgi:fermentation-respiration switch protein FrsA (DUF1100 family)
MTWKRRMLFFAGVAVLGFLGLGLVVRILERRTLYHPMKLEGGEINEVIETVGDASAVLTEVVFDAEDGVTITGWLGTPSDPIGTLLWFHGNAGNVLHRWRDFARFVSRERIRVLIVDYRGFGRSEGSPDEEGLYRDAAAALDFLVDRGTPSQEITLLGRSLGGAVAIELASRRPVKGLILESTFTSAPDMARDMLPFFPASWFIRSRFPNLERIRKLTVPILMFHGREDRIVPIAHGERLAAATVSEHRFVPVEAGHNDLSERMGDEYFELVTEFVGR